MDQLVVVLTLSFLLCFVAFVFTGYFFTRQKKDNSQKNRRTLYKLRAELNRNPNDRSLMAQIAQIYYQQEDWIDAHHTYRRLYGERFSDKFILPEEFKKRLQYAISAYKSKEINHAHQLLIQLKSNSADSFEYNKYAGLCFYYKQEYTAALASLKRADSLQAGDNEVRKHIAFSDYQLDNFHDALRKLKIISDTDNDPYAKYVLGNIYLRMGNDEQAQQVFAVLTENNNYSASSYIALAEIARRRNDNAKALVYYKRASKLVSVAGGSNLLGVEVLYKLGVLSEDMKDSAAAFKHFGEVQRLHADYKDTPQRLAKMTFLKENKAMGQYLVCDANQFAGIVRTLVYAILKKKPTDITPFYETGSASLYQYSVIVQSSDKQASDNILFRFARTQTLVSLTAIRDFYDKISGSRFARGVFVTAGTFSQEAQQFASGRTIILCAGEQLKAHLERSG